MSDANSQDGGRQGWLLLIHQIPPKPDYLRVKIWRRLQGLGAVAIKNSVYVLPESEATREDFHWVQREIVESGGEATICEAQFVDGLDDDGVRALFQTARNVDYDAIAAEAADLLAEIDRPTRGETANHDFESRARRLRRRLNQVAALDFFQASSRPSAEAALAAAESRLSAMSPQAAAAKAGTATYRARTWVTRPGVGIDRIASAWLIRRFIDPNARFRFAAERAKAVAGEIRFDTYDGEFTHEGDRCTFEVLIRRFALDDPALTQIAEIIHDLDLKDGKFGRDEAAGISRLVAGIVAAEPDDERRIAAGGAILESLYRSFRPDSA